MEKKKRDAATAQVRAFYDGPADIIYKTTWGENLHLGVPRKPQGSYEDAIQHATELMALHAPLDRETRVLDLGSGYGGPAGFLASTFGCGFHSNPDLYSTLEQPVASAAVRASAPTGLSPISEVSALPT